jgi:hypothetical protein
MKDEFRRKLARLSFEEKIRKVGELIRFSRKIKAVTDLDARKGIPVASVREEVHDPAKNSKK